MFAAFLGNTYPRFMIYRLRPLLYLVGLLVIVQACGGSGASGTSGVKEVADLPFSSATSGKQYAELVLKSIKTNRDKPLQNQFKSGESVNYVKLKRLVNMYSTGIGGRDDWEYHDFFELSKDKDESKGFDYAWLDQKGKLGMQIFIRAKKDGESYYIDELDFRSRLDVIDSVNFPSGQEIDDYKKINYDWVK